MFDLYDDDCNGSITIHELELMVEEVVGPGHEHLVEKLMKMLDGDGSQDISFTEFMKVEKRAGTILKPCFTLQLELQRKCLGRRFWKKNQKKVTKLMTGQAANTLVDFFAKMLEKDMPPPPEPEEEDLESENEDDEEVRREKTWEEIEAERLEAEKEAKLVEYGRGGGGGGKRCCCCCCCCCHPPLGHKCCCCHPPLVNHSC
jgi:hypothetical protein